MKIVPVVGEELSLTADTLHHDADKFHLWVLDPAHCRMDMRIYDLPGDCRCGHVHRHDTPCVAVWGNVGGFKTTLSEFYSGALVSSIRWDARDANVPVLDSVSDPPSAMIQHPR